MWDLERENCIAQLNLPGGSISGGGGVAAGAPAVEHVAASSCSPLLYAADGGGTVRIFDLRSSEVAGSVQHTKGRLAGEARRRGCTFACACVLCCVRLAEQQRDRLQSCTARRTTSLSRQDCPPHPCCRSHTPLPPMCAGMVAEPGGTPHHLVLGYPGAQLAFLDCRMVR
mgnify:CR=1 FL=1